MILSFLRCYKDRDGSRSSTDTCPAKSSSGCAMVSTAPSGDSDQKSRKSSSRPPTVNLDSTIKVEACQCALVSPRLSPNVTGIGIPVVENVTNVFCSSPDWDTTRTHYWMVSAS